MGQPGAAANLVIATGIGYCVDQASHLRELGLLAQQHGDAQAYDLIADWIEALQTRLIAQALAARMASVPGWCAPRDLAYLQS